MHNWDADKLATIYGETPDEELIGLVVHDLRNRATPVVSASALLLQELRQNGEIDRQLLETLLETIQQSGRHIIAISDALMKQETLRETNPGS